VWAVLTEWRKITQGIALISTCCIVLLFWVIWLIIRSVKGIKALDAEIALENPKSLFFKKSISYLNSK
jgi:uncharacterized membrane protein